MTMQDLVRFGLRGLFLCLLGGWSLVAAQEWRNPLYDSLLTARARLLRQAQEGARADVRGEECRLAGLFPGAGFVLLYDEERALLAYVQGDWEWLRDTLHLRPGVRPGQLGRIAPAVDDMAQPLGQLLRMRYLAVRAALRASALDGAMRRFLELDLLDRFLREGPERDRQAFCSQAAERWLERYADSPYAPYVRRRWYRVYGYADYGWGMWMGGVGERYASPLRGSLPYAGGFTVGWSFWLRGLLLDAGGTVQYAHLRAGAFLVKQQEWKAGDKMVLATATLRLGVPWAVEGGYWIPFARYGIREYTNERVESDLAAAGRDALPAMTQPWLWGVGLERRWGQVFHGSVLVGYDQVPAQPGQSLLQSASLWAEARVGFTLRKQVRKEAP